MMAWCERGEKLGYAEKALDHWADCARTWAAGGVPKGLRTADKHKPEPKGRDVFLYVISGFKAHNPAAEMALVERLA